MFNPGLSSFPTTRPWGVSHKLLYELLVARYKLSLACDQAVMSYGRARANEAGEGPGRRIEILSFATDASLLNLLVTSAWDTARRLIKTQLL